MKLEYNLDLLRGDYLDKLKQTIILNKNFINTEFYQDNPTVLGKILFLAWQKGLCEQELFDLLNYIPTNDKVLKLVFQYRGISNRETLINVFSVVFDLYGFETKENEVVITLQSSEVEEDKVLQAQNSDQIIYNGIGLSTLIVGSSGETAILSFIKLFLPVGVLVSFQYVIGD